MFNNPLAQRKLLDLDALHYFTHQSRVEATGVTAGIPWNAFAFLPLYFQLSGFQDLSAGEIVSIGGQLKQKLDITRP